MSQDTMDVLIGLVMVVGAFLSGGFIGGVTGYLLGRLRGRKAAP